MWGRGHGGGRRAEPAGGWACGHTTELPQAYELSPFAAPLATAGVVLARLAMGTPPCLAR